MRTIDTQKTFRVATEYGSISGENFLTKQDAIDYAKLKVKGGSSYGHYIYETIAFVQEQPEDSSTKNEARKDLKVLVTTMN